MIKLETASKGLLSELSQPKPNTCNYQTLLTNIEQGFFKTPKFQREFVWTRDKSTKLLDSIIRGHLIGTFTIWRTQDRLAHVKNLGNAKMPDTPEGFLVDYILNGQQRPDKSKIKNNPVKTLTDLISLVHHSSGKEESLLPFSEIIREKFAKWLIQQESSGRIFTLEQKEWLFMIKNNIESSISIDLDALDNVPFSHKGDRVKFYEIFGNEHEKI